MTNDLCPYTIDDLNRLRGIERDTALKEYQDWMKRERKQEKKEHYNIKAKIYRIKNNRSLRNLTMISINVGYKENMGYRVYLTIGGKITEHLYYVGY